MPCAEHIYSKCVLISLLWKYISNNSIRRKFKSFHNTILIWKHFRQF